MNSQPNTLSVRPSLITTLKQAHHFAVKNFFAFLPLTLKTFVLGFLLTTVLCGLIWGVIALGFFPFSLHEFLFNKTFLFLGFAGIIIYAVVVQLIFSPLLVSVYRRALLNEEIDSRYLKRLLGPREINFFIADLKFDSTILLILLIIGLIFVVIWGTVFTLTNSIIKIPLASVGGISALGLIGLWIFLYSRLMFLKPNVVLDLGSKFKQSIHQSRHYTFFLWGAFILGVLITWLLPKALSFFISVLLGLLASDSLIIACIDMFQGFLMNMLSYYYSILFIPASISYVYKSVVLEKENLEESESINSLLLT